MSDHDAHLVKLTERVAKIDERVTEVESHIPRIGHVEHDVIQLAGKHARTDREVADVKDLLIKMLVPVKAGQDQLVADLDSMKKQAVSNQKQINKLFSLVKNGGRTRKKTDRRKP